MAEDESENWYRLDVLIEEHGAIDATSLLWDLGAMGVEVQDRETYAEDRSIEPVPEGAARLVAYFSPSSPREAHQLEQEIVNTLTESKILPLSTEFEPYEDESWRTAWKEYFKPVRISDRVVVGPPWEDFEAPDEGAKLVIEPGMAFGTGTHETTGLSAAALDKLLARADTAPSVLDVGCGSGILSMLAAKLGAEQVVGLDINETSLEVARENARLNDLVDAIEIAMTPVDALGEEFDIVVANILAHVLLHIREGLQQRVRPGGALILSGIDVEQVDEVERAFCGPQWEREELLERGEWIAVQYRKKKS